MQLSQYFNIEHARRIKSKLLSKPLHGPFTRMKNNGIKPNHISLIGFGVNLLSVYFFLENRILFITFSMIYLTLDGLDGMYARDMKLTSQLGNITDKTLDTFGFILIYIKYWTYFPNLVVPIIIVLILINTTLMFILKIDQKTGASSEFRFFCFFGLFSMGLIYDLVKYTTFTPIRAFMFAFKSKK